MWHYGFQVFVEDFPLSVCAYLTTCVPQSVLSLKSHWANFLHSTFLYIDAHTTYMPTSTTAHWVLPAYKYLFSPLTFAVSNLEITMCFESQSSAVNHFLTCFCCLNVSHALLLFSFSSLLIGLIDGRDVKSVADLTISGRLGPWGIWYSRNIFCKCTSMYLCYEERQMFTHHSKRGVFV